MAVTISAREKHEQWQRALETFIRRSADSARQDTITYSAAINVCARGELWQQALDLFETMRDKIISHTPVRCTFLQPACEPPITSPTIAPMEAMRATEDSKTIIECVRLSSDITATLAEVKKAGKLVIPGAATLKTRTKLTTKAGKLEISGKDVITYSAAISACENSEQWQQALSLLANVGSSNALPDVATYNAAISAFGKRGPWQQALELFQRMTEDSAKRGATTCDAAIGACEKGGRWQAKDLFKNLVTNKVRRDTPTYTAAISACENFRCCQGHAGESAKAEWQASRRFETVRSPTESGTTSLPGGACEHARFFLNDSFWALRVTGGGSCKNTLFPERPLAPKRPTTRDPLYSRSDVIPGLRSEAHHCPPIGTRRETNMFRQAATETCMSVLVARDFAIIRHPKHFSLGQQPM
jgi:pentatricopeptide repeat protein